MIDREESSNSLYFARVYLSSASETQKLVKILQKSFPPSYIVKFDLENSFGF
jgi:hypothetical protein